MTKKLWILGLLFTLVFALNGCGSNDLPPGNDKAGEVPVSSSESTKDSTEEALETDGTESTQSQETEASTQEEAGYSKNTTETETTTVSASTDVSKSDNTERVNEPENSKQQYEEQQNREETTPSKENEPTETNPPEPAVPPSTEKPQPDFNINYWVEYTKSYAQSIGLTIDSTATECWDNPITASPNRTGLQDDIVSRLNRYKNVEGFTAVWVWVEKVSDTEYELYIGYA